jgi:hypothetical protein
MPKSLFIVVELVIFVIVVATLAYNVLYQKEVNKAKEEINILLPTTIEVVLNIGFILTVLLLLGVILSLIIGLILPQVPF